MKEKLLEILKTKKARYLTEEKLGNQLMEYINEHTSFLQTDHHRLQERIYCVIHDINEHNKCPNCFKEVNVFRTFEETKEKYLNHFCSVSCMRANRAKLMLTPIDETILITKEKLIEELKEKTVETYDLILINSAKYYLKQLNIDYTLFNPQQAFKFILDGYTEIPKCSECGKPVKYHNGIWEKRCSLKCSANSVETVTKREETNLQQYGVKNVFQSNVIKDKMKETNLKHFGVDHHTKTKEFRHKMHIDNPFANEEVKKKIRATWKKNLGVETSPLQSPKVIEKMKATQRAKYNGKLWTQTEAHQQCLYKMKDYIMPSGKIVKIQGYENKYLDKLFKDGFKEEDIFVGPAITEELGEFWYEGPDKEWHRYFPDIYIKSLNKIVEVKCDYTMKTDLEINLLKERCVLETGLDFDFAILE